MRFLLCVLLICFSAGTASAKTIIGRTYAIEESNLLNWIEAQFVKKSTQDKLDRIKKVIQDRTNAYIERPSAANHVTTTIEPKTHYYDPSITVPYTIQSHDGKVIHLAGTSVNPLDYIDMTFRLVFFDGDDTLQVKWVKRFIDQERGNYKLILTKGSPSSLMKALARRVSFDQAGLLTKKMGILRIPAIVSQEYKLLRIDEKLPE